MTTATLDRAMWSSSTAGWTVLAGLALGVAYVLSPFTVLFIAAIIPLLRWAVRGIEGRERQWLLALLVIATATRVLVVLGLFLLTNHREVPFGSVFGDEEYFIRRSLWLRNLALGLPMHRADFIYAYDDYSRTSYLYVLAVLQILLGPAPYGAHLFSICCYLAAAIVLHRLVRPAYGRLPALLGLAVLLFLPTHFAWSISALKDPLYLLVMTAGLAAAVTVGRPGPWPARVAALALVVASAFASQSIREGGLVMAGAGAGAGLLFGVAPRRPRLVVAVALALLIAAPIALSRGHVKDRVVTGVRQVASVHWGHVNTPGFVYAILDDSFYQRRAAINEMTFGQGVQYVIGSLVTYVTVPLPWQIQSRAALSYLPEQIGWYLMVALVPIGIASGLRRDPLLTSLLACYAAIAAVLVAVTSGNIGTLVRHRGLAVPYLLWLSVLGGCEVIAFFSSRRQDAHADHR